MTLRSFWRWYRAAARTSTAGVGTGAAAVGALVALVGALVLRAVGARNPVLAALTTIDAVADRDRRRIARFDGRVRGPAAGAAAAGSWDRRELIWTLFSATFGLGGGALVVLGAIYTVQDLTFPLWWHLVQPPLTRTLPWPQDESLAAHDVGEALVALPYGLLLALLTAAAIPLVALLEARLGRPLLNPSPDTDLQLRVTELTATRAAALDAHAAELRRIERALHDGAQSRLVAVSVLLGAARRAAERGDPRTVELMNKAQEASDDALEELRTVARDILPPVLQSHGLAAALEVLAARCAVPCTLHTTGVGRCAASIEATVYYVVAETLTNVSRHSGASHASVTLTRDNDVLELTIADDGRGGAGVRAGSGLVGIRGRVEAHDGSVSISSPAGGPTRIEVLLPCGS